MKEQNRSAAADRQRKFLLVLPLLVLPFVTLMFWALGGGKTNEANAQVNKKGLNMELPNASFGKEQPSDKMSYYDDAATDSAKLKELMKNDPYYSSSSTSALSDSQLAGNNGSIPSGAGYSANDSQRNWGAYRDPNEEKVYRKLEQLNTAMNAAPYETSNSRNSSMAAPQPNAAELDRLEQMMQAMNNSGQPDPEMQQINGMLESILDLQHPDRVQEKLRKASESKKGQVFAVTKSKAPDPVSTLQATGPALEMQNGFYSFDVSGVLNDTQNAVTAVIHEDQTVVSGSTVKLRLTDDIYINGVLIPGGNFIYGLAALNGERLAVKIDGIRYGNSLYPVSLNVYDLDGLDGIYIPGAISRDVAKSSADRSIQNIGLTTLDPSIGAQAAGAGIEAAKGLLSKKVKLIKVMVKAGYQVLLKDEKQKQQN